MSEDRVDWRLLPEEPERFFQLEPGYDRKQLKRRYNALIRRFKPERHPAEFQRIRAAFELLDNRLRYLPGASSGHPSVGFEIPSESSQPATSGPASVPRPPRPQPAINLRQRRRSILEQIHFHSPTEAYRQIRDLKAKTPTDYYALAVLADVVSTGEPEGFCYWLIQGVGEYPRDAALLSLLYDYLRRLLPHPAAVKAIEQAAEKLDSGLFFFVTEHQWQRLLVDAPFGLFAKLLQRCERRFRNDYLPNLMTFLLRTLRIAVWKAPGSWVDRKLALLDENQEIIQDAQEMDLVFLDLLREYLARRASFVQGPPMRMAMDQMFRDYCEKGEPEADRAFLSFQLEATSHPEELLECFPLDDGPYNYATDLLRWIADDVQSRVSDDAEVLPMVQARPRVLSFLLDIQRETSRSARGILFSAVWGTWEGHFAVAVLASWASIALLPVPWGYVCTAGWAGLWLWRWRQRSKLEPAIVQWFSELLYHWRWRQRLLELIRETHVDFSILLKELTNIEDERITYNRMIVECLERDFGLGVFSELQQFLK